MTVSELIQALLKLQEELGDVDVKLPQYYEEYEEEHSWNADVSIVEESKDGDDIVIAIC